MRLYQRWAWVAGGEGSERLRRDPERFEWQRNNLSSLFISYPCHSCTEFQSFCSDVEPPASTPSLLWTLFQVGIVGLPNVGKSTTFNLLTHLSIPAE